MNLKQKKFDQVYINSTQFHTRNLSMRYLGTAVLVKFFVLLVVTLIYNCSEGWLSFRCPFTTVTVTIGRATSSPQCRIRNLRRKCFTTCPIFRTNGVHALFDSHLCTPRREFPLGNYSFGRAWIFACKSRRGTPPLSKNLHGYLVYLYRLVYGPVA